MLAGGRQLGSQALDLVECFARVGGSDLCIRDLLAADLLSLRLPFRQWL
jgi:hypothetical protein